MATLSWMPESPVWLEWKKKKESASAAKVKLWGNTSYAPLEEEVNGSIENGLDVEGEVRLHSEGPDDLSVVS